MNLLFTKRIYTELYLFAEKQLEDNPKETEKVLSGVTEMEIQAHIDLLMSELVDLNNEVKAKQELVRKPFNIVMFPKSFRIEHPPTLVIHEFRSLI